MAKTPYEVRLDVLAMAKDMLEKEMSHEERKMGRLAGAYPSSQDIMNKADELYSFVSDNSTVDSSASANARSSGPPQKRGR